MKTLNFESLAVPGVRELKPYTPGKPTSELEREYGVTESIKLASNENPLGASPKAIEAIKGALGDLWLYPDANGFELKQAISAKHDIDPACITLGNGSNDVLVFLAQVFLRPGLESVFSQYAFAVYPIATQMVGATAKIAPALPADHPMPFGHDLRALYESVGPDTRLVFIANPNNPTGTWLTGERLRDFVSSLPPHVICVIDEAYTEYAQSDTLGNASSWLDQCPNLVVTRTFSKAYGLAALRVGYALSNPGVADLLNRVRPAFNVNALGLTAATAALSDSAFIERSRAVNAEGMSQLSEGLKALGASTVPSAANFILAGFDQDAAVLNERLLREGVIVRPVGNYGLDKHLRITIGTAAQNQRVLESLKRVLR